VVTADFLIERADTICTCAGPAPRRGLAQRELTFERDAVIAAAEGRIVYVGPSSELSDRVTVRPDAVRVNANGCTVLPGFVDPHTHLVYAGDRGGELRERLAGVSYADIAARGGGILRTVTATRAASEDELFAGAQVRAREMLACGTTTCEAKSGYGLTLESELRQLRVLRRLDEMEPIDVVPTFLGAHEVPPEFAGRRSAYISHVVKEMLPAVAEEGLAEWCDVFCDEGIFSADEAFTLLDAGARAGLKPRIHAEELAASGGSRVAARVRARSADHLLFVDGAGAEALADGDVCAVLLPATALYLRLGRFAPARMLIDAGVPVALGTDINGAGGSPSMPLAIALACGAMAMTLEEAIVASTINAAWSLDRAESAGSLEPGKLMDAVLLRGGVENLLRVPTPVYAVIKRGQLVVDNTEGEGARWT
jgi:imidazolonepropionase